MIKEKKALFKYFILIFLVSVLAINWNHLSWLFNYKAVSRMVASQFESKIVAKANELFDKEDIKIPLKTSEPTDRENSIEIPKILVTAPLLLPASGGLTDLYHLLDNGVVHFPGSALPASAGQTIILGHSAPAGWPKIKYDWVFTRISELAEGDEIFVYFNHKKYVYRVTGQVFLERGEELPQILTNSENMLILISCWPPGKDLQRIAVLAK